MTVTLIVADTMGTARDIAATRGWPRSSWRYVRDGSDIDARPQDDIYVDRTAETHPRVVSIHDALHRRLVRKTPIPGADRRRRGVGTLESAQRGTP